MVIGSFDVRRQQIRDESQPLRQGASKGLGEMQDSRSIIWVIKASRDCSVPLHL